MAEQKNKKQTSGYFDIVGYVSIDSKTFSMNTPSKSNADWIMNTFNPKIEGENGESLFVRISDGYSKTKGKTIYATSKTNTNLEIPFADRHNQNMIDLVDEKSFVQIGIGKKVVKNDQGKEYKTWEFNNYLSLFDAVTFLHQMMPLGSKKNKIRITGKTKYSTYKDETQRNFEVQKIYLLDNNEEAGKEMECKFTFTQNVLLTENSLNISKWNDEGIVKINAFIHNLSKKKGTKDEYEGKLLPLELIIRAETDEKKNTYNKVIEKYLTVSSDTVRRINIEGVFNSGYSAGNVKEEDLPQDAKDLIEDGLYSKEEVLKMYAIRDTVDELLFRRPVVRKIDNKPAIDKDDTEFEVDYINSLLIDAPMVETVVEESVITDDLLSELEGL